MFAFLYSALYKNSHMQKESGMKKFEKCLVFGAVLLLVLATGCAWAADAAKYACGAGGASTEFTVTGDAVSKSPMVFTAATLETLPQTTVWEVYTSGKGLQGPTEYHGVLLWDVLKAAGLENPSTPMNAWGNFYVLVTGTDCYQQLFSLGEINPTLGGAYQVTVAYGKSVPEGDGFARLIPPGDKGGDRTVYNVMSIQVINGYQLPLK